MTEIGRHTAAEAQGLLGPHTVVLQPLGALGANGSGASLEAATALARAAADRAARLLAAAGVPALVLPPVAYGLSRRAQSAPGWISLRPGTLWALLEDVVESLTEQGVRRIVLVNGCFDPEHLAVLDGVILDHSRVTARAACVLHPGWTPPLTNGAPTEDDDANVEALAEFVVGSVRRAWPEIQP